jgi:hypothetical protein
MDLRKGTVKARGCKRPSYAFQQIITKKIITKTTENSNNNVDDDDDDNSIQVFIIYVPSQQLQGQAIMLLAVFGRW